LRVVDHGACASQGIVHRADGVARLHWNSRQKKGTTGTPPIRRCSGCAPFSGFFFRARPVDPFSFPPAIRVCVFWFVSLGVLCLFVALYKVWCVCVVLLLLFILYSRSLFVLGDGVLLGGAVLDLCCVSKGGLPYKLRPPPCKLGVRCVSRMP
jgi:hypothetical protein